MALSIEELQVGNIVNHFYAGSFTITGVVSDYKVVTVKEQKHTGGHAYFHINELEGEPISESWLRLFGFSLEMKVWSLGQFKVVLDDHSCIIKAINGESQCHLEIRYVHQLQNIYHLVTGSLLDDSTKGASALHVRLIADALLGTVIGALKSFFIIENNILSRDPDKQVIVANFCNHLSSVTSHFANPVTIESNIQGYHPWLSTKITEFLLHELPITKWPQNWFNDQEKFMMDRYPSMMIHDIADAEANFIVIELKKHSIDNGLDREWAHSKLCKLTTDPYKFEYGIYIEVKADNKEGFSYTIFKDGAVM